MTTAQNKKLTFIPTELNAFTYLKNRIKHQDRIINNASKWIIILLLWCITLSGVMIYNSIQQNRELINKTIINQEGIPLTNITLDELEVIND